MIIDEDANIYYGCKVYISSNSDLVLSKFIVPEMNYRQLNITIQYTHQTLSKIRCPLTTKIIHSNSTKLLVFLVSSI